MAPEVAAESELAARASALAGCAAIETAAENETGDMAEIEALRAYRKEGRKMIRRADGSYRYPSKRNPPPIAIEQRARIRRPTAAKRCPLTPARISAEDAIPRKYPFPLLEVGQSFIIEAEDRAGMVKLAGRLRAVAAHWRKQLGRRYQTAQIKTRNAVRVKRIE